MLTSGIIGIALAVTLVLIIGALSGTSRKRRAATDGNAGWTGDGGGADCDSGSDGGSGGAD